MPFNENTALSGENEKSPTFDSVGTKKKKKNIVGIAEKFD